MSFFPIILAGPIQRPVTLLPQIKNKRVFNYEFVVDGLRQILWGLFTKVVIADNLAGYVDKVFSNHQTFSGSTILVGVIFYTVQIYADFSGYSNMAIGVAKLFGFRLINNFAYPYFARDIREFWKRWHISLVSWFRDYVFLPISYSVSRKLKHEKMFFIDSNLIIYIIGIVVTWTLTGLWHGANFTFIFWGFIHGFLLILYQWFRKPRKKILKNLKISNSNFFIRFCETILTLIAVSLAWIFFRSDNLAKAFSYISIIFSKSIFSKVDDFSITILILVAIFFMIEWLQRSKDHALNFDNSTFHSSIRWGIYYITIVCIFIFGKGQQAVVYFQF